MILQIKIVDDQLRTTMNRGMQSTFNNDYNIASKFSAPDSFKEIAKRNPKKYRVAPNHQEASKLYHSEGWKFVALFKMGFSSARDPNMPHLLAHKSVSDDDVKNLRDQALTEIFSLLNDKNRDGKASREEWEPKAFFEIARDRVKAELKWKMMDANADGFVDKTEYEKFIVKTENRLGEMSWRSY